MIYIPAIVIVGFYFEKWRAIATAIAACGSSSGIIVFPTLMQLLSAHKLTWRSKFQIISLTCIAMAIMAMSFKPLRSSRVMGAEDRDKKIVFTISEVKEGVSWKCGGNDDFFFNFRLGRTNSGEEKEEVVTEHLHQVPQYFLSNSS